MCITFYSYITTRLFFSDGFLSFLPGNTMLGSTVTYLDIIKELTFDDTAFGIFFTA